MALTKVSRVGANVLENNAGLNSTTIIHLDDNGRSDFGQMEKVASKQGFWDGVIEPKENHSYLHVITTGSDEVYGPNHNGDGFNENTREHKCTENDSSVFLDNGLSEYHKGYMELGAVYTEHRNSRKKDPLTGKSYMPKGKVVAEALNTDMHRGELVIEVPHDNFWKPHLNGLENGKDLLWSQASTVPYDICSVCGSKQNTQKNYCKHLKFNKLGYNSHGQRIYAINDMPFFHDISLVKTPADIIAFGIEKVASANTDTIDISGSVAPPTSILYKLLPESVKDRLTTLEKAAQIEKEIPMKTEGVLENLKDSQIISSDDEENSMASMLKGIDVGDALHACSAKKMIMPPKMFIKVMTGKPSSSFPGNEMIPSKMLSLFKDMLSSDSISEDIEDGTFLQPMARRSKPMFMPFMDTLEPMLSMNPNCIQQRIVESAMSPSIPARKDITITITMQKEASAITQDTSEIDYLMNEYGKYQLSVLSTSCNSSEDLLRTVASNVGYAQRN